MAFTQEQQEEIKGIIRAEFDEFLASDRYTVSKTMQFLDGRNIQLGRSNGTKIGTASDQLLGFYGVTPVNKPDTVSDPTISTVSGSGDDSTINTNFTNAQTAINTIIDRLQELGLLT